MLSLLNVSSIAAPAAIATSAARTGAVARSPIMNLVPLLFIGVIFYMLIIRPQQKHAKAHKQMLLELKQGDKIVTNGGIVGIIKSIDETSFINIVTATDTMLQITKDNIVKKI